MESWAWGTILGWLLGLVTIPLGDKITRAYRKDDLQKVLNSELKSFANFLALSLYLLDSKVTPANDSSLVLIKKTLQSYHDGTVSDVIRDAILNMSFDTYKNYSIVNRQNNSPYSLKKASLKVTNMAVNDLWLWPDGFRQQLLLVVNQTDRLNEEVALSMKFFELYYSAQGTDQSLIMINLNKSYEHLRNYTHDLLENLLVFLKSHLDT
jgi:spore germination protein GerM